MRRKKKKRVVTTVVVVSFIIFAIIMAIIINKIQNSSTTGMLNSQYNAGQHVQASITGTYKISGEQEKVLTTSDGLNKIIFNTENESDVLFKKFDKVENIKLDKNNYMIVHYKIDNNNQYNSMVCHLNTDITRSSNMKIEYSLNYSNWSEGIIDIFGVDGASVASLQTLNVYVRISVKEKTKDAKFDGSFNFTLSSPT